MSLNDARVLLVEDDLEVQDFIRFLLEKEKYHVITAKDGQEGMDLARESRPELILLDIILPRVHGFEVCERLRQDPSTCLIPIIMVTSLNTTKDRLTGIKLGADEYLSKPFEPVELLARVERLISRARQNLAANPLTGLPGPVTLDEDIRRRLASAEPFSVGVGDLNGLARYNEGMGYEKGDGVIRLMGTILRSAFAELGNRSDVLAHLGHGRFGFISTPSRVNVVAARVLENVEALMPHQYDQNSREKGNHVYRDAQGVEQAAPFLSFAMGTVDLKPGLPQHPAQVLDLAQAALRDAKKWGGNHLISRT